MSMALFFGSRYLERMPWGKAVEMGVHSLASVPPPRAMLSRLLGHLFSFAAGFFKGFETRWTD